MTSASSVSRLIDRPSNQSTKKVPMIEIGTVTAGMIVARTEPRNR